MVNSSTMYPTKTTAHNELSSTYLGHSITHIKSLDMSRLPPLGHIWDVMLVWRKGNINRAVSVLQYCVPLWWCTIVRAVRSTGSGFDLAWFSSLSAKPVLSVAFMVWSIFKFLCVTFSTLPLVSWALNLLDVPLSFSDTVMTYIVSSGTSNPTVLY